jgi:hypothetical protein
MQGARIATAALLAAGMLAAPAAAKPDARNAKPKLLSVELEQDGASLRIVVVGRDRDDVVRGTELSWGADQPAQGTSACTIGSGGDRRRRGRKERFESSYTYPAAGRYTIVVRVISGGCGKRPQQRSRRRTLTVDVG